MPEIKTIGVVDIDIKAVKTDDPDGAFEAVLSAPTEDRDGEIIDAKAFEPLPDRITIDVDHGMTVDSTVGSGTPFYDGDLLKVKGTFSSVPRAQETRTLVTEGHISKMSVAFMNAQRAENEDGKVHIIKAELLNAAIVSIPSNREASILAAKALAEKGGARNSAKDAERLQTIHDLAVANGAACEAKAHLIGEHGPELFVVPNIKFHGSDIARDTKSATTTNPEDAAAPAAAPPADVNVVFAQLAAARAQAELLLLDN